MYTKEQNRVAKEGLASRQKQNFQKVQRNNPLSTSHPKKSCQKNTEEFLGIM